MDAVVLPRNANYRDVLPLEAHSQSKRRTYFPVNGQTFTSTGNNIIRIDISADAFLNPKTSYLSFRFTNNSGQDCGIDFGGGHSFIRRCRVEQSGNILTDCNNYHRLLSSILLPAQGNLDSIKHRSITENCRYANDKGAGALGTTSLINGDITGATVGTPLTGSSQVVNNAAGVPATAGSQATFCIPLMNGLLGPNQSKMIPLQLHGSSPITIELELANVLDIGCYAAGLAAGADYQIDQVKYIAQLVEVPPQITEQVRMVQEIANGRLILSGTDWTHFSANIPTDATGIQSLNVPARRRSIKSIWWTAASQAFGAGVAAQDARYNLSFGGHMNMVDYSIKVGAVQHPPTPVRCDYLNAGGPQNRRSEQLYEVEKSLGVASSVGGAGVLSGINFATRGCDVANMCARADAATGNLDTSFRFCPFSIDMESFQRVSADGGAVNTADRATPITLQLNIGNAGGAEAMNVDTYVCYNSLFYISSDGSIRVSF